MAKQQRRGDDVPVEQAPVAQETPAEGFPVPPDATPEAGPAEATDVEADDPTAEDGGPVAEAETQVNPFDVKREFRKHAHTGEVVAVELVGGQLQGARLCSRPEEQTAGALPVMMLEHRESDVAVWYRKNAMDFRPWEPPQPPKMLMDRLRSLYEQAVEARARQKSAKDVLKIANSVVEEVDNAIFHALRRMHDVPDGQAELPLEKLENLEVNVEPPLPLEAEMSEETAQEVLDIVDGRQPAEVPDEELPATDDLPVEDSDK